MPYSSSVTFGESDTMRRGTSAAIADRARKKPMRSDRFMSKLELRSAADGNSRRAETIFKVSLVKQVIGFEVQAERARFAEGTPIAQGSLGTRRSAKSECSTRHRSQVVRRAGIAEYGCHSRGSPLRGKRCVVLPRTFGCLPDAGDRG